MAIISFYHDTRYRRADGCYQIKLAVRHKKTSSLIPLNIYLRPDEWDNENCFVKRSVIGYRQLNDFINDKLDEATGAARVFCASNPNCSGIELHKHVMGVIFPKVEVRKPNFLPHFLKFANSKSASTKGLYMQTVSRMRAFCGDGLDGLFFEDVNRDWLIQFEAFLAQTCSKNGRNIHLRNIRAVFNDALDEELTVAYPFRKFKIKPEPTRKRALPLADLRRLFTMDVEPWQREYRDMFMLIFFLIGINIVDLCRLERIVGDRVTYVRAKTHRVYDIKVEPEAMEIINRYRGRNWLVSPLDRYSNHCDYTKHLNRGLQSIGECVRRGRGGKKFVDCAFPGLTSYWARHSWATVAASLDIPKETIAAALGHGGNSVTDIYIDFDRRKVDDANRRVIDWVLYGKK